MLETANIIKKLLLLLCVTLFLQTIAFAQQTDSTTSQTENSDSTDVSFWKKHNVQFAGIPMVNYDPTLTNMNNLGLVVSHDTRDFIYNPYNGDYMNFKTAHYREARGSDYKFDDYQFDFTKFFNIDTTRVIATKFYCHYCRLPLYCHF